MQPSSNLRSVFIYSLTGILLLGAIILGVQFARNRSNDLANTNNQPVVASNEQTKSPSKKPASTPPANKPAATKKPTTAKTATKTPTKTATTKTETQPKKVASTGTGTGQTDKHGTLGTSTNVPNQVPATGAADILGSTLAVSALAFSGLIYARSRRGFRATSLRAS